MTVVFSYQIATLSESFRCHRDNAFFNPTEKCQPIIADGREMQTHFFTSVTAGLTDTELKLYQELSEKIRNQVIKLEKEL